MEITGIICEYNPLHLGHRKQMAHIRGEIGPDSGVVCLMSGNFVQRGAPAVFHKMARAEAALRCGADLVLELPVTYALSSAEGFAAGGVRILSGFCDRLCFGAETADAESLAATARALLSEEFRSHLRTRLDTGLSFPAARQAALEDMGYDGTLLQAPNNILAVEYCKAILAQGSAMLPMAIVRQGGYHDTQADPENPSATSLRRMLAEGEDWKPYVPEEAVPIFQNATPHTLAAGQRAVLAKLRTMTDAEFETLPYGSEGLWRKFMHACREETTCEDILTAAKSKRYTRTRLERMLLCAFLGITEADLAAPAPYTRVLGFNAKGREILNKARNSGHFPNIGEKIDHPYQLLENRCGNLYALFAQGTPEAPGQEGRLRVLSVE